MLSPSRALGAAAVLTVCAALALGLPAGSGAAVGAQAQPQALATGALVSLSSATVINATRIPDATVFLRHGKLDGLVRDVVLAELRVNAPDTVQDGQVRFLLTADPVVCAGGVLDDGDGDPLPDPGAGPGANLVAEAASSSTAGVDMVSVPISTRTIRRWFTVTHNLNARRLYVCVGSDSARTPPRTWTSAEAGGRTSPSGLDTVWIHQGDQVVLELPQAGDVRQTSEAQSPNTGEARPVHAINAVTPTR